MRRATLDVSLGDFRRWSGDAAGARRSYEAALDTLREKTESADAEGDELVLAATAYSGLGDREHALRYANRLAESPLAVDAVNGALSKECLARTLARLGDRDAAFAALERVTKEPGRMTLERLRLDPDFAALREDPRFDRLLAAGMTPLE